MPCVLFAFLFWITYLNHSHLLLSTEDQWVSVLMNCRVLNFTFSFLFSISFFFLTQFMYPLIMLKYSGFLQMRRRSCWRSWLTGNPSRCQISTTTCLTCSTMKAVCTLPYRWARDVPEVSETTYFNSFLSFLISVLIISHLIKLSINQLK